MAPRQHEEVFDVSLPVERAWVVMSDTQHLNQIFFGLGASTVVDRQKDKARIRGTFGMFAPEYNEYPWVFEAPTRYLSVREFTKGLLKRLEVECTLTPRDGANTVTQVKYRMKLDVAGGPFGAIAGTVFLARLKAGLAAARDFMRTIGTGSGAPVWPPANPQRELVVARLETLRKQVTVHDDDEQRALTQIFAHLADQPEPDVARIRPYEVAASWHLPKHKVLAMFLHTTKAGITRLSWDLLCPSCEAPTTVTSLKDLPQNGHCPACDIDFTTGFDENVEATFSPEPSVRSAQRLVFCHGSPSTTKSWIAQVVLAPGESKTLQLTLGAGRYRIQAAGLSAATLVDVRDDGDQALAITLLQNRLGGAPQLPARGATLKAGPVTITITNSDDHERRIQLAHRSFATYAATAADVTALGLFRELFGNEALSPEQHVAVGHRSIVFTDLVGSTAMYERIGDAAAYGLVRAHFRLLFDALEAHAGSVVKTVGDCVMASFDTPLDATRAARAMVLALRQLKGPDGGPTGLKLRVGVHTGPCLAVSANGQVDYFGRTVNLAARVEGLAGADEVVLSWSTAADVDVQDHLKTLANSGDVVSDDRRSVKGVDGEVAITRIAVSV